MARTFRRNDVDAFEDRRAAFANRDDARRARARIFEDAGFDDGDAIAARPFHGREARAKARAALDGWR